MAIFIYALSLLLLYSKGVGLMLIYSHYFGTL